MPWRQVLNGRTVKTHSMDMIGSSVHHYKILEKLGEGGMGVVYKAEDTRLKRIVALKFLPHSVAGKELEQARFLQEAQAASALNHPNVCGIHTVGEYEGHQFIDMEYVDGVTLRKRITTGPIPADAALLYALQICEALLEAHGKGIVHRDVKTENIMVNAREQIKVMDFGLAKLKGAYRLTRTSGIVGTIAYLAPEVIMGGEADPRSDIFALGVVLFQMLTTSLPFRGDHEAALMYSILNEDPADLSTMSSAIPPRISTAVQRMLAKNPAERYQNVQDVMEALRGRGQPATANTGALDIPQTDNFTSIAVLPFADLSPAKDQEYFCDGIAEEIITALTKLQGLQVVARTSAFAFKGRNQDVRDIGKKLAVSAVLEGGVRKAGKRLRITAQLINVADGYHLWSDRYDREEEDIFAIQDEISQSIVKALKVKLAGPQQTGLVKVHTENLEAYNLFLQGRYYWSKRTADGLHASIEYFQRAIAEEPGYAIAHAALADSYSLLCSYHLMSPVESIAKAKVAALRAVELDPSLAEAHEALGHVKILYDWEWESAGEEYRQSIALNPFFATARQRYALLLSLRGQQSEATEEIRKAEKLDPLSLIIITDTALIAYVHGHYEEAIGISERVLSMDPQFPVAMFVAGLAHEQAGRYEEAIGQFHRSAEKSGSSVIRSALAHCYGRAGKMQEATSILEKLIDESRRTYVSSYSIAVIYAGLGQTANALQWLARARDEHSVWHIHLHLAMDPRFASLRPLPEFAGLLTGMGL
jgi:eukaryotic-like serine/threonine-protein kinase